MPAFPIVDSHVHLYDPAWLRYSWTDGRPPLDRAHLVSDLDDERGAVQLEAIVFAEVWADRGLHLAEAAWVQALADREPRLRAQVACAPVEKGAAVEEDLARLVLNPTLRGIRRLLEVERDAGLCLEPAFLEGVRRVGRAGLPFDICVKHWQLVFVIELVRRCPDVLFVLDHIGKPGIRHGMVEPWRAQLRELSRLPNVVCKLSGVVTEAEHSRWSADEVRPYIDHALECFGFERIMYGSDWPVSRLTHRYPGWVEIVDRAISGCSEAEALALYRGTANATYRLGL